jgi:hypothetical protein
MNMGVDMDTDFNKDVDMDEDMDEDTDINIFFLLVMDEDVDMDFYVTRFCKTMKLIIHGIRVAEPELEPAGAETFGRSRSRYTEVSAPAPGSGSRAN